MTVHWLETSFLPGYSQLVRANENKKLSIWIKTHGFFLILCKTFISCLLSCFAILNSLSFCLYVLHCCFPSFAPLFWIVKAKHPPLCSGCWQPAFARRPWNVGKVTLTKSHVACRDQEPWKIGRLRWDATWPLLPFSDPQAKWSVL